MHVRILLPTQLSLFQHPPPPQPLTTTPLSSLQHQPLRRHNPPVPSFHEKNHRNDNDDDMDLGEHEEDEEDPSTWMHLVTPGETIVNDAQFMKGHGAFIENETMLVANVQGVVERVNKLVSVRPLRTRYSGDIGDVVVGRITEIGPKRWKVNIHARQDAVLQLSAIPLPGGIQRRKSESDELSMRHYYAEGDIVISEIHQTTHDDTLMLHTRFHHPLGQSTSTSTSTSSSSSSSSSSSFSMPTSFHPDPFKHHEGTSKKTTMFGTYCWIPHTLIPRLKSQFLFLKYTSVPIQVVLGRNGGIWMMPTPTTTDLPSHHEEKDLRMMKKRPPVPSFEKEVYLILARLHHCFLLFMKMNSWVNEKKLKYFYLATLPYPVHELNQSDVLMKVFRDANEKMREMEEGEGGGDEDSAAVMGR